jgi:hypothetical protein
MGQCRALDCGKPSGRRVLCRDCAKALQPGELWTLRMAGESPMHSQLVVTGTDDNPVCYGGAGWPIIDGTERLRVHYEEEGLPCWTTVKGVRAITDVLAWLEYELATIACAAAISSRRKAKADKLRLEALRRITSGRR